MVIIIRKECSFAIIRHKILKMKLTSKPLFIIAAIIGLAGLFILGLVVGYNANPNQTGNANQYLPIGLLLVSIGLLAGVIAKRKKDRETGH